MGMGTGIGAAAADALYGSIAAFGLTLISDLLLRFALILYFLGGLYLLYLGWTTFISRPFKAPETYQKTGYFEAIVSTFLLTMTSPVTIAAFTAFFTSFRITAPDLTSAFILLGGVFTGSGLWWVLLSSLGSFLRTKLNIEALAWVNKISGIIIALFGVVSLVVAIR